MAKVLIVDDSASLRTVVKMALTSAGYEVHEAGNPVDAIDKIKVESFNLIISEIKLKEKLVGLLDNIFTNMKELSTLMKNSMEAV